MSARTKKQAEIIPPDKDEDGTARAGVHLRMPPLIDNVGGWRNWPARFVGAPISSFSAAAYAGGKNLLGGLVYRLTLLALVGTALALTGYGIWQARHMNVPQFDGFWHTENTAIDLAPSSGGQINQAAINDDMVDDKDADAAASVIEQGAEFVPSGDVAALNQHLQALNAAPDTTPNLELGAPMNEKALPRLQAQYDDLQEKYAALLRARQAEQQAQALQAAQNAAQDDLLARAALGDLLLRLDIGAAYDDLLEAGDLARVLRRSEWTLLALYADSGIPTRAALLTRFELWVANAAAPDASRMGLVDNGFYRAMLDWLRLHAVGLVTVRAAPLATAEGDIAMIANALGRGRHDEAAWRMGALLRRMESDRSVNHPDMVSLQLLYDDTRAAAEISPMLAALRDDYMAGARP